MIADSITQLIGNTPLLKIAPSIHGILGVEIFAKLEYMNPFGSIKDRTALGLMKGVGEQEQILESSSGNTAKALGILASMAGKKLTTITNRIKQKEVENILKILGIAIENLPPGSECPDPNDPNSPFRVIETKMAQEPNIYFWTDQYTNRDNSDIHFETTAPEINRDLGVPDYFFSGLGTTGSSRGIAEYFLSRGSMLSLGIITAEGCYIPGIRNSQEMGEVGLFEKSYYSSFLTVTDTQAIESMLLLMRQCGMLVGPTTGAVYRGMIDYLKQQDPQMLMGKKVVFIACDRMESYISYIQERVPHIFNNDTNILTREVSLLKKAKIQKSISLSEGSSLVIDMRSHISYSLEHIVGSLSFPFSDLTQYIKNGYLPFPKEKELIFICPFGEESIVMAQIAESLGYSSSSLEGGYLSYRKEFAQNIIID